MSEAAKAMGLDEFVAWQAGQEARYEFVDGRPVALPASHLGRVLITINAIREIGAQFRGSGNPCDVFTDGVAIRTGPGRLRRPDASVLCPPFAAEAAIADRPRLVLEVLSEGPETVERLVKLGEYQGLASLDYIVFVEPAAAVVGLWQRDAAGAWRSETVRGHAARLELPALGIALRMSDLYARVAIAAGAAGPRLVWDGEPPEAGR